MATALDAVSPAALDAAGPAPLLAVEALSKHFPGVVALDAVDFDLRPGRAVTYSGEELRVRAP